MEVDAIKSRVYRIIYEQFGSMNFTESTNLIEDLHADSIDVVEVIIKLEYNFDLEIPDEDIPKCKTVKDIISYLSLRLSNSVRM